MEVSRTNQPLGDPARPPRPRLPKGRAGPARLMPIPGPVFSSLRLFYYFSSQISQVSPPLRAAETNAVFVISSLPIQQLPSVPSPGTVDMTGTSLGLWGTPCHNFCSIGSWNKSRTCAATSAPPGVRTGRRSATLSGLNSTQRPPGMIARRSPCACRVRDDRGAIPACRPDRQKERFEWISQEQETLV